MATNLINALKAHGAGNDFVLIPDLQDKFELTAANTRALCHRNFGIGGDGAIRIGKPITPEGHAFMDYRNADGSIAEMCGNGVRTVAAWIHRTYPDMTTCNIDTRSGTKAVQIKTDEFGQFTGCSVAMGVPKIQAKEHVLQFSNGHMVSGMSIDMGNPHFVITVPNLAKYDCANTAEMVQSHSDFPEGVNVEFISKGDDHKIKGRIFERGVGETLASGTGSSAMATCAITLGWVQDYVSIELPGGVIRADWSNPQEDLMITGPAIIVADLIINLDSLVVVG